MRFATAIAVTLCGCRFNYDAVGAGADASIADAAVDGDVDAAPLTVCPPAAVLCEGFERGNLGAWSQEIAGGDLEVVREPVYRGNKALRATTPAAGADAYLSREFAAVASGSIYTRAYYHLPSALITPGFVELTNTGDDTGVHFHYAVDGDEAMLIVNDDSVSSPDPLPRDRWVCVEMHVVIDSGGGGELFIDGQRVAGIDARDTVLAGGYSALSIGLYNTDSAAGAFEVYIDEIAVDTAPIGCD